MLRVSGNDLREEFKKLIQDFSNCQKLKSDSNLFKADATVSFSPSKIQSDLAIKFQELLGYFGSSKQSEIDFQFQKTSHNLLAFADLLTQFESKHTAFEIQQKVTASDFNMLAVLGLESRELCHSRLLVWLLDWNRKRFGTHAQGSLGFRIFLETLGLETQYASDRYFVHIEKSGKLSRIDLEIGQRGKFLIWIENKIWAQEGCDQTNRELRDLRARAEELGIDPNSPNVIGLFLTPDGRPPACPFFGAITWHSIAEVLLKFAGLVEPIYVRQFAEHYADIIRTRIIPDYAIGEDESE
jgi:hypothetical protein